MVEIDEDIVHILIGQMKNDSSIAIPSLGALETFVSVARHGTLRGAAMERRVDPSAISHVIRGLEDTLGVRLFNRTSRSVSLTQPGRELFERIGPALGEVADALQRARTSAGLPSGTLRLNVPRIVNTLIIEPMVGRFLAAYPDIRLEVVTFDGLADLVGEGFDAGIRRDRRLAPGMIAVPVGPARRFAVVGAPAYFADRSQPAVPDDLRDHRCIERRFPNGTRYAWEFEREGEVIELEAQGPLVVDDTNLMLRAALDGVGLAFVFEELVADHIASGALIRVLDDWCPVKPRFYLYYPGRRQVPAPLRAFIGMVTA
ncbi:MAG: LysR family transcriptional regulator [Tardiphaga sp.]